MRADLFRQPRGVGFTGTSRGMTSPQREAVREQLRIFMNYLSHEFHHGDCVGADEEAHEIARALGYALHVHPPDNDRARAYCQSHVFYYPLPYLKRNRAIVDATEQLIAAPRASAEQLRSGTWSTVRYARAGGKRCVIVLPDGSVKK